MTSRPIAFAVSRWWDDPFARGGWSLLRVGSSADTRRALGAPIDDRLIIAGEATNPDQAAMVHGAFDEGVRAARWAASRGHRRVAVIGAGAAGCGAAHELLRLGCHPIVIEARDRIGGRVRTEPLGPGLVGEAGANWLQQGERNTLAPIASSLGLRLVPTDFHAPRELGPAGELSAIDTDGLVDDLRAWLAGFTGPDRPLSDVVGEWLATHPATSRHELVRVVTGEVYLDSGAPMADLSARFAFEPGVGEGDRWIVGGYRQVLDRLLDGIELHLSWPIHTVRRPGDRVSLAGEHGEFTADAAIVTVPVAVLQSGAISFDPPLPAAHSAALAGLTTGRVEKIALRFDERWWDAGRADYLRIFGPEPLDVCEWLDMTDVVGVPAIAGLFVGGWLDRLWRGDDREVADRVTAEVLAMAARP